MTNLKTTLTQSQIDQITDLIVFGEDPSGVLTIEYVKGNIKGDVEGNIKGCVFGSVGGDVLGNIKGRG